MALGVFAEPSLKVKLRLTFPSDATSAILPPLKTSVVPFALSASSVPSANIAVTSQVP